MTNNFTISPEEILFQTKLSCQIPQITQQILTRHIITTEAAKAGIEVSTEELQQVADRIRLDEGLMDAPTTLSWLEQRMLSVDDFEQIATILVLTKKLSHHLFSDKIEPCFVANQLDYAGAILYEVILEDEDLVLELYCTICEGETTFPEVAHLYIENTELRRVGGYLGKRNRNQLDPAISAAVFAATPPQVLKPILTSRGFHLIFVEELIEPILDEELQREIMANLFDEWIQEKLDEFAVSYLSESARNSEKQSI
jgi:parvulin-like peptidyl-prolyl isomerase